MLSLLAHMQQCNVVYAQGPVQSEPSEPPEPPPEPPEPPDSGILGGTGPDICGVGVAVGGLFVGGGWLFSGGGWLFSGSGGLFAGGGDGFCLTFIFTIVAPGTIFAPAGGSVATT